MAAILAAFILWLLATSKDAPYENAGNKLLEWIGLIWEVKQK